MRQVSGWPHTGRYVSVPSRRTCQSDQGTQLCAPTRDKIVLVRNAVGTLLVALAGCASTGKPAATAAPSPATAQVVHATVLANGCQGLGATNGRLAEQAMYALVEGCNSVPGGVARFEATLEPGGRVRIAAASGQPPVVPICVLKHPLVHKVPLTKPCSLDVRVEEETISMPRGER
jgi:hypothetical protein